MSQAGSTSGGSAGPTVPTQFTTDNGVAVPAANNLNVFGGIGSSTSGSGSTITINVESDSFDWSEKNADFNAQIQNGYYCNASLTATLPATSGLAIGSTVIIYVDTSSTVGIRANAGQMIQVGNTISAAAGITFSNTQGAMLELNFKPSDTTWHTISSMGSWTTT